MTMFLRHSGSCVTPTHLRVRRVGWHGVLWIWQGQLAQQLKAALEEMVKDWQYLMKLKRANIFNLDDTKAQEQLDEWDELMLERTREVHVKEEVAETERDVSVRRWLRDELYRSNDADVQKTDELCAEAMQCFAVTALAELKKIAKDYIDNGKYTSKRNSIHA